MILMIDADFSEVTLGKRTVKSLSEISRFFLGKHIVMLGRWDEGGNVCNKFTRKKSRKARLRFFLQ